MKHILITGPCASGKTTLANSVPNAFQVDNLRLHFEDQLSHTTKAGLDFEMRSGDWDYCIFVGEPVALHTSVEAYYGRRIDLHIDLTLESSPPVYRLFYQDEEALNRCEACASKTEAAEWVRAMIAGTSGLTVNGKTLHCLRAFYVLEAGIVAARNCLTKELKL